MTYEGQLREWKRQRDEAEKTDQREPVVHSGFNADGSVCECHNCEVRRFKANQAYYGVPA